MNCGILINRKWNYRHVSVLPLIFIICSLTRYFISTSIFLSNEFILYYFILDRWQKFATDTGRRNSSNYYIDFINYELTLILRCDSSATAVWWMILQYIPKKQKYISCRYSAKIFTQAQQRYEPSEKEILGAVVVLKSCESSITGANLIVQMDCRGIILLTATSESNSKMSRYLSYLNSFTPPLQFQWVSGRDRFFSVADLLSRTLRYFYDGQQKYHGEFRRFYTLCGWVRTCRNIEY